MTKIFGLFSFKKVPFVCRYLISIYLILSNKFILIAQSKYIPVIKVAVSITLPQVFQQHQHDHMLKTGKQCKDM